MAITPWKLAIVGIIALCFTGSVTACEDESYRQFDFWLGHWQVFQADGSLAGNNHIARVFSNCVIHEQYTGSNGYRGASYNIFDQSTEQWHQTWVDNTGLLLQLKGGLSGNTMVMWGEAIDQTGRPVQHRIRWTPQQDGRVTQLWQVSRDQGLSWQVLFQGFYRKAAPTETQ